MRRLRRFMGRGWLFPAVWMAIAFISVYLLIRLITLSFSDNLGQAKPKLSDVVMSELCSKVMEAGSSLVEYQTEEEENFTFPVALFANQFALHDYVKSNNEETLMTLLRNSSGTYETAEEELLTKEKENTKIGFKNLSAGLLSREYILTNGAIIDKGSFEEKLHTEVIQEGLGEGQLPIGIMDGNVFMEETKDKSDGGSKETMKTNSGVAFTLAQLADVGFLINNFYIVDGDTRVSEGLFDSKVLLGKDMTIKQGNEAPQILIYHTHSQEAFIDSRANKEADTVVGVGTYLKEILEEEYGYSVIHDKSCYDVVNGVHDRSAAYDYAEAGIEKILKKNPTIEVVIDLHRDGIGKRSISINGKDTAQIMLFNGLCRDQNGPLTKLENPYLQDNLAFSLQLQLKSLELYPGLFYKNYLHAYRYNQHVREKSILIELGTDKNTLKSAKNAMPYFAEILDSVLKGDKEEKLSQNNGMEENLVEDNIIEENNRYSTNKKNK